MENKDEKLKKAQIAEARARNISHNVRCTECGSQSIEDSQADIAILLRKLIRDEIKAGKTDKEIFKKLEDEYVVDCRRRRRNMGIRETQEKDECAYHGFEFCQRCSTHSYGKTDHA